LEIFHAGITTADWFMLFKTQFLQDKWAKGCVAFLLLPEKKYFCAVWWNPGAIPPNFYAMPHCRSSLIFQILSKSAQVLAENPSAACQSDCSVYAVLSL